VAEVTAALRSGLFPKRAGGGFRGARQESTCREIAGDHTQFSCGPDSTSIQQECGWLLVCLFALDHKARGLSVTLWSAVKRRIRQCEATSLDIYQGWRDLNHNHCLTEKCRRQTNSLDNGVPKKNLPYGLVPLSVFARHVNFQVWTMTVLISPNSLDTSFSTSQLQSFEEIVASRSNEQTKDPPGYSPLEFARSLVYIALT